MGKVIMSGLVNELTVPVKPLILGDVAEGQIITIKENNNPVEFYVAKHNYEEGLNGKGRTLVVRRYAYDQSAFGSSGASYLESNLNENINNNYGKLFSNNVLQLIGTTKFYYSPYVYNESIDNKVQPMEASFFVLSATELGGSEKWMNIEGSKLPNNIISLLKPVYNEKGNNVSGWTRTACTGIPAMAYFYSSNIETATRYSVYHYAPVFTLPATTKLNPDRSVIE